MYRQQSLIMANEFYIDRAIRQQYRGRGVVTESDRLRDGVYVDASVSRSRETRLGFAIRRKGMLSVFSTLGRRRTSTAAEAEAVQIALTIWPSATIFTDCQTTASRHCVNYIPRRRNNAAHNAARLTKGFIPRDELDRMLEGRA
jgi:hypothetical protein